MATKRYSALSSGVSTAPADEPEVRLTDKQQAILAAYHRTGNTGMHTRKTSVGVGDVTPTGTQAWWGTVPEGTSLPAQQIRDTMKSTAQIRQQQAAQLQAAVDRKKAAAREEYNAVMAKLQNIYRANPSLLSEDIRQQLSLRVPEGQGTITLPGSVGDPLTQLRQGMESRSALEDKARELKKQLDRPDNVWRLELMREQALEKQREERRAQNREMMEGTPDFLQDAIYTAMSVPAGVTDWTAGLRGAAEAILPERAEADLKRIPGWQQSETVKERLEEMLTDFQPYVSGAGQVAGSITRAIGYSAPSTLLSLIGGGPAAQVASVLATAVPMYGSSYKDAVAEGATEEQAQKFALVNGILGAVTEHAFGFQRFLSGADKGLLRWVISAAEEGGEEVIQGIIENGAKKMIYDSQREWGSLTDPDAVFSGARAWQEFYTGFAVGGLMSGGSATVNQLVQYNQTRQVGVSFLNGEGGRSIDTAIAIGLQGVKGTEARSAAEKIAARVENNQPVSPYAVGRMVLESTSAEAQAAQALDGRVRESASRLGVPETVADSVAATAVALGQKVEFAPNEQFAVTGADGETHYAAGRYIRQSDTVLLNAAANEEALTGYLLAHELTHSVENTAEYPVLADTVRRVMGEETWQAEVAAMTESRNRLGDAIDAEGAAKEVVAHWIGENLYTGGFARAVMSGKATSGNTILRALDKVRRALGVKNSRSARNIAMLERLFMQALESKRTGTEATAERRAEAMATEDEDSRKTRLLAEMLGSGDEGQYSLIIRYTDGRTEELSDARQLTDEQALTYLGQAKAGELRGHSYIPVRKDTPQVIIDTLEQVNENIDNRSLVMQVHKAQQAMKTAQSNRRSGKYGSNTRGHALTPNQIVEIVNNLDNPNTIIYQTNRRDSDGNALPNNVAVFVEYNNDAEGLAVIEFDASIDPEFIGDEFGDTEYHTVVTVFEPDTERDGLPFDYAEELLSNPNNMELEIKRGHPTRSATRENHPNTSSELSSNTFIPQNGTGVNTYSMQDGQKNSGNGQNAFLPEGAFRSGLQEGAGETDYPSVTAGGDTSPDKGRQGGTRRNGNRTVAQGQTLEELAQELGDRELDRRMYMAMQTEKLPTRVTLDGIEMDTAAYLDAVEERLPDSREALETYIAEAERRLQAEAQAAFAAGNVDGIAGLPVNLQLFAARRKLAMMLDAGEEGSEERRFYWQRTRGLDANKAHEAELLEYLAGRSETYNPISNQETLDKAKEALQRPGYAEGLVKRLGRYNPRDRFTETEMAAAMVLINNARNDGDLELYTDLVRGLSRKGTDVGRAVQILSMQAKLTPEGTIRTAQRTMRQETDRVHGKGTSEAVDDLAGTVVDAVERAVDHPIVQQKSEEDILHLLEQIRKGEYKDNDRVELGSISPEIAEKIRRITGIRVDGYKVVIEARQLVHILKDHGETGLTDRSMADDQDIAEIWKVLNRPDDIRPSGRTKAYTKTENGKQRPADTVIYEKQEGDNSRYVVQAVADSKKKTLYIVTAFIGKSGYKTEAQQSADGSTPDATSRTGTADTSTDSITPKGDTVKTVFEMSREELVEGLVENVRRENDPYITEKEIRGIIERAVTSAEDMPAHLKKMLQSDKTITKLAERIAAVCQNGHLNMDVTRRAFEEALELPTLTPEDVGTLTGLVNAMQNAEEGTPQHQEAMEAIYRFLGSKLPVTFMERWQSWRKFAMLANPKTHLRNIFSNVAMFGGVEKLDTAIATGLQRLFVDKQYQTAALGWRGTEHGKSILPAVEKATERAVVRKREGGGKYDIAATKLGRYKRYFQQDWLNKASDFNSKALEDEDIFFFRRSYANALGQILVARGLTEVTPEIDQMAYDRAVATVFQADNAINDVLTGLKRWANSDKAGRRLFGYAVDVVIPFSKTPANIVGQTLLHSPVGVIKGAWDIAQACRKGDGQAAADAINTLSKGMTGTALLAVGLLLGFAGLFNTGFGKTEKERAADELAGVQENAFIFGNWSITLDWLQPAASPLIVGASIAQRLREDGFSIGEIFGAMMDGTDSLFEMSMLQSLYDILGGYDAGATATLGSVAENLISQSIPTLVGQAARAIDPVQRKTRGDNDFETVLNRVLAKLPGLTYLLEPELDVWGDEVYRTGKAGTGAAALNAFQQFLSPSNVKVGTGDDAYSREILRLFEEQGAAAIPAAISRDEAIEHGLDHTGTNRTLGKVNRTAVEELFDDMVAYALQEELPNGKKKTVSKRYSEMTDEERRRVLGRIYKSAKAQYTDEEADNAYFEELIRRLG